MMVVMFHHSNTYSQATVTAGISPTTLPCGGGTVSLTANGVSTVPVFGDDFNSGSVAAGWSASPAASFNNPCGASVDGTTYLWMGNATSAPRALETATVDVSCGGTVCFDFKFMCESCGDSSPCEGADRYNEGVGLQYSTDGGATWITFGYFAPNGDILTYYPSGQYSPYASGSTPFTSWNNYCFNIPAGAFSANTMFRLRQWGASGTGFDHWGIDNFYVYANPCSPYYYDWEHIPGSPDAQNVSATVTSTTTFTVHYTNGTDDAVASVTVTVNNITIDNVTISPEACLGDDDASITTTASTGGGTAPFTYTLSGPTTGSNSTGSFSGLSPGLYTMTLEDAAGCTDTYSFTVDPGPACCTVSATGIDPSCNGGSDGSATANPANGVAPYTYQWYDSGGTAISGQTSQTASGLAAGTYSVTITDANGCTSSVSVTLSEPTALSGSTTATDVSCNGSCDGSVTVTPTGGTSGYTYSINGGTSQASATFTGLCPGTQTIEIEDDNGCTFTTTQAVAEPAVLNITETDNTDEICGQSNGTSTVTATGGTTPYSYELNGSTNSTGVFTGLTTGAYVATVTDDNGCTATVNVNIVSTPGPTPFVDTYSDVVCAGGLSGSVTIGVTDGTSPYTYSLDGGTAQASNTFSLAAGSHTVTVTDDNGCTGDVTFSISEPTPVSFTTVVTDANCHGICDGSIEVTASGSNAPYTYSDDNGTTFQGSNILSGLCDGSYNVVVSDVNGCLANATVAVGEPDTLDATFTFVEPSCYGICDAEIHISGVTGGVTAYEYSIDNGSTYYASPDFTAQCAGTYDIIVRDANLCEFEMTGSIVTTPPQIQFNFVANNPSNCGAQDGSFEIAAYNGTAPYTYSIDGGTNWQTNGSFSSLYAGLYTLVVSDMNGCMDSTYSPLSDQEMTSTLTMSQDVTCYNGSDGVGVVNVTSGGSPPITYTLNTFSTGNSIGPQANGVFGGLIAGEHTVQITDGGLCINLIQFTLTQPDTILFDAVAVDISCPAGADGEITFSNPTGGNGAPYEYSIDGGATYQTAATFTGLTSGTYTLYTRDSQGCEGSSQITLTEPSPFDIYINATDLTCYQNATGFVQVVASGATSPYVYDLGGTTNTNGVFSGLAANTTGYNITITDDNGCTFDTIQALTEPTELLATFVVTDALCYGSCDGIIDVTATGGTPAYAYSSDGGTTFQSSASLTGLCQGTYTLQVRDDNGCTFDGSETVNEPTEITFSTATTPATCGNDNATITVTAANGTPGYTYAISNDNGTTYSAAQASNIFTALAVDDYIVMVIDNNACEMTNTETTVPDPLPQIDLIETVDPLCNGDANGTITITSSNGVGTHEYSMDGTNYQASNVFTGVADGTYTVYVRDANGCIDQTDVTLTHPDILAYNATITDLLCNSDFTGAIALTATGGTTAYQYSIDNGTNNQSSGAFDFIAAGTYTVLVTDANGCTATGTETVNEPAVLDWTFTITDPSCFQACDGTVVTSPTGGTTPYTYQWSNALASSTDTQASGICDGTYSVILTDANGCQIDSTDFILTDPAPVQIDAITVTDALCNGDCNGEIEISVPTMTPAIVEYSIDNGVTFETFNLFNQASGYNLCAGSYDIIVRDANGCTSDTYNTSIAEPEVLVGSAPTSSEVCYNELVTILPGMPTGGTTPYTYDWQDSNGNTYTNTEFFDDNVDVATTYSVTVTDANGCQAGPYDYTLTPTPPLSVTASADIFVCPGESTDLSVAVTGGQLIDFGTSIDYSYSWDTGNVEDTLVNVTVTPTSSPSTYTVTVSDLCGEVVSDEVVVTYYDDPTPLVIGGGIGCEPYEATFYNSTPVVTNGGSAQWSLGDGTVISNTDTITHTYPNTGCYDVTLTVTTSDGCTASETFPQLVCVYGNPTAQFYYNPGTPTTGNSIVTFTNNSSNAETYQWTFGNGDMSTDEHPVINFNVDEAQTIEACLVAVSDMGCTDTTCQDVEIFDELIFYVPNVFTPDDDPYNDSFTPIFTSGYDPFDYHLTIFNRWGEIIFESYNSQVGWDGYYNGHLVEDGVYIWQIEFGNIINDERELHRGHVTLLK